MSFTVTQTFKSFCKETSEVLETIGDVNFETAIACLKDVSEGRSNRPERELDGAIMSLRTAYEAFCSASAKAKILWGDDYGRKALYSSKASVTALLVASFVCESSRLLAAADPSRWTRR